MLLVAPRRRRSGCAGATTGGQGDPSRGSAMPRRSPERVHSTRVQISAFFSPDWLVGGGVGARGDGDEDLLVVVPHAVRDSRRSMWDWVADLGAGAQPFDRVRLAGWPSRIRVRCRRRWRYPNWISGVGTVRRCDGDGRLSNPATALNRRVHLVGAETFPDSPCERGFYLRVRAKDQK